MKFYLLFFFLVLAGCASRPSGRLDTNALAPLAQWLDTQEQVSWNHLQKNISPREPKVPGGPTPKLGIVVAALQKKDPDYYFHWVRDSAHVMAVVADVSVAHRPYLSRARAEKLMDDFVMLTRDLQRLPARYGLGEPRYTVEGQPDTLPWSRPQFDGPALRALAVLRYLQMSESVPRPIAETVLRTDLDFLSENWNKRGFDIWEEYRAENYHTRLVQAVALELGAAWFEKQGVAKKQSEKYVAAAQQLYRQLDDHWDPARGFLRSQVVIEATDGYTAKKTDLDSAVIVAVVESGRLKGPHSVLDDRVHATVAALEDLFRRTYPINAQADFGLAYGRYYGDVYYGGNPWYLVTAYYAQFYFRLARALQSGETLVMSKNNIEFFKSMLAEQKLVLGEAIGPAHPLHARVLSACKTRGENILRRLQLHTPSDGQLYEQIDKTHGTPVSSRGIGWSHSAFLAARLELELLNK